MERKKHNRTPPEDDKCEDDVTFSQVTAVVTDWMRDFLFLSICRSFKERNLVEFNKTLASFEAISDNLPQTEKVLVCAFLARVMHGQMLDILFEEDNKVSPLMSAAKLWSDLKETVEDESLVKNMTILLIVQSVAVCLEKGLNASYALQWTENNLDIPSTLRIKLGTVVAQKDNYHPLIESFSYNRLLETTQIFIDAFLEKNPSDHLLKAATKVLQSSGSRDTLKDTETKERSQTESITAGVNEEDEENTLCMRSKRKLLSTKMSEMWTPGTCKKPVVCLTRISKNAAETVLKSTLMNNTNNKKRKPRSKWTWAEDKQLIAGVRLHGLGKWSHILQDFNFGDRTGTMLKDRWRTLQKARLV